MANLVSGPLEATWMEEGCKLLLYWSQWGRLFLKDSLVYRRWEHKVTGQDRNMLT